jgi:hypothetical protein
MGIRSRLLLTLPLTALAIAGCGGGGGGSSTAAAPATTETVPRLSKEELISQGDAICAEVNAAVGTVSSTNTGSTSQLAQEADLYSGMVQRLKGLGTPEDTAGYPQFIAAAEGLAQAESDARLAAERGEEGALAEAESKASSALASFQSAAQGYGFKDCGEAPSAPSGGSSAAESTEGPSSEATVEEAAPEEAAPAPETGSAGTAEGGGAAAGGGSEAGGGEASGGSGSGGIGPG